LIGDMEILRNAVEFVNPVIGVLGWELLLSASWQSTVHEKYMLNPTDWAPRIRFIVSTNSMPGNHRYLYEVGA